MKNEFISLVQECTNKYFVKNIDADEIEITIRIPKKFRTLWLSKLSGLKTTKTEIDFYQDNDQ